MNITLSEAAEIVKGRLDGPADKILTGANSLSDAGPEDIAYFSNPRLAETLKTSKAACVLIKSGQAEKSSWPGPVIYVKNPQWAFTQLLRLYGDSISPRLPKGVHSSAIVHPSAKISPDSFVLEGVIVAEGAEVGPQSVLHPGSYVGRHAKIGSHCVLHPGAKVLDRCELGDNVILQSGVVIGGDGYGFVQVDGRHEKIPQLGRVVVEDDVEIGANSTIDRAMHGVTRIGKGTKFDNLVHIAHNCTIGKDCLIVAQAGIAGSTEVGDGAVIAGQVAVRDNIRIGKGAVVMPQSGITKSVPDNAVMFGTPARPAKEMVKMHILTGKLPELFDRVKKLEAAVKADSKLG